MKKSWKTTLGGVLASVGALLSAGDGIYKNIGVGLATVGSLLLGIAARDNSVSSEDAGIKK